MSAEVELRCLSKLHGMLLDGGVIEVKCNSTFCGARPGWTVLHKFDINTGKLLDTEEYKSPPTARKDKQ